MSREAIAELISAEIGLAAATIGEATLAAAVSARLRATGADEGVYLERLRGNSAERAALIDEVVVPETWFFRDVEPFRALQRAATGWNEREAKGRPMRLLSLPCSSGEEAYSMAIALSEVGLLPGRFEILGVDVSPRALQRASAATYGRLSFRGDDLAFRERYFEPRVAPGAAGVAEWTLVRSPRERVRFARGNVLDLAATPEIFGAYDAIFCRNLLIYLTPEARQVALAALVARLPPHGLLVLGHADAIDARAMGLASTGESGAFAFRRAGPAPTRPSGSRSTVGATPSSLPSRVPTASTLGVGRTPSSMPTPAPGSARAATPAPAAPAPAPAPAVAPPVAAAPPLPEVLARAQALADAGALAQAAAALEPHLERFGADAAPYHLLGVIAHAGGDVKRAQLLFEKALYCDPEHLRTLLHLALLADARGDAAAAEQLRKRAQRTPRRGGPR